MLNRESAAIDPFEKFLRWYSQAGKGKESGWLVRYLASPGFGLIKRVISVIFPSSNLFRPDIATLATVAPNSKPSARSVLFRGIVEGGFSFYTDYESDKGRELELNSAAVMLFYWGLPPRQVRIDGNVKKLSRKHAEDYWASRTRANQAASAAVRQSSIVSGSEELLEQKRRVEQTYRDKPIPCPDSWGGYSLVPDRIEFWEGKFDWLHNRERYFLSGGHWNRVLLAP